MPAAWMSSEQRALERALKAGVEVERAYSESGEPLTRWTVDSATTWGRHYQVRIIEGRFTCTCQGSMLPMCLHRAAVMHSLGVINLDPPRCRGCGHVHKPGRCVRWCDQCKGGELPLIDLGAPARRAADEYTRLYGED